MALIGKIIAMTGVATVQNEKGDKRALHPGDQIQTGDSIQTTAGVDVDVQLANGRVIHIGSDQMVAFTPELAEVFAPTEADSAVNVATIDTVIQAIQDGRDINQVLEETAAGGAGGSDGGHSALYLERINQTLNTFGFEDDGASPDQLLLANGLGNLVPFVGDITPDTDAEGAVLVHTVTLTNILGTPQTFAFSIVGNTATAGVDFTSGFTFSNGVTFTPSADNPFIGTITVPANVGTFTVSIQTINDSVFEGNETYTINVGEESATGTITDNDDQPTVISVIPGAIGPEDDAVPEGTPLVYNVTLSTASGVPVTYPFVLGGGTASADDIGAPTFSNGVTLTNGVITVPAGVTSFTVTVPTVQNDVYEGTETVPLTIGGVQGIGLIDDEADKPTVISVIPGAIGPEDDAVPEGTPLVYNVTLSAASGVPVTYPFVLGGGTASADDIGAPTFSNGVTLTNGVITVPAGVTSFTVTVPTVQNDVYEGTETVPLTIGGVQGIGLIDDEADRTIVVTKVTSGVLDEVGNDLQGAVVIEGKDLQFKVDLNAAAVTPTTVNLVLTSGTGTVGVDTAPTGTFTVKVSFDGGDTFENVTGTLATGLSVLVPVGASSFIVNVPTIIDAVYEEPETIQLAAGTSSNAGALPSDLGTITDIQGFVTATGLSGQYFGYNDNGVNRSVGDNTVDNLNSVQDLVTIINLRNEAAGGSNNIVGTNQSTVGGAADVYFKATEINYNPTSAFINNLGGNTSVAGVAGNDQNLDPSIGAGSLRTFLGKDADSAKVDAGLANTTDAIIRLTGKIFLERGNYDFKVLADDGFSLRINNKTLIEYDGNQAPTSREYTNLYLDDATSGLTGIELLYWEQGREGVLQIQYKLSSETEYKTLSLENLAMFSNDDMKILPDLDDTQDIVSNGSGGYIIRSGETILGNNSPSVVETLVGTSAKDVIDGQDGDDTLQGLEGADTLRGGAGNDRLEGGAGNDLLDGGTGADTMIGGTGDDIYIVDNAGDIVIEAFNEGTDTIVFSENYNFSSYSIAANIENVEIRGVQDVAVIGNSANNRIVSGEGNDTLSGGDGNDILIGGRGSDTLTGGAGNDVFVWRLGDHVGTGVPEDVITDFKYTGNGTGNAQSVKTDSIDLRDLLQGEQSSLVDFNGGANPENLLDFLNFSVDGASTVINISTTGGFASGFSTGAVDQKIVLQNVNLFAETGSGSGAGLNDQTLLLQKILANGTLIVD